MEQVRQAYGVMAEQYIELFGTTAHVHPDDLALIVRHLSIRPGVVLDLGCGPGHFTAHLRSLEVDATGLDLVPEFIDHARATHPHGRYELGSMHRLPVPDRSVAGMLAWYSLIHLPPDDIDGVLAELRRAMAPAGTLVVGFFDGDDVVPFEHKVVTAYHWPVDQLAARLQRAGFTEVERRRRPGLAAPGHRPHAALAVVAD
jgi:ubiquinone/menaquinone biosynthesis C-methylase UbiE